MTARRWIAILVLAVALVGCGGSEGKTNGGAVPSDASTESEEAHAPTLKEVTHADAIEVVKQSDAKVMVINFWATWCVPCVEEFPSFVKLDRTLDDRGVDVMFISTDFPSEKKKVVEFLADHEVTGTSYLKAGGNTTAFVNSFNEEWTGAVPATFLYDSDGTLLAFWEGKVSYDELKSRVIEHLEEA